LEMNRSVSTDKVSLLDKQTFVQWKIMDILTSFILMELLNMVMVGF
jgi:hypothetical protein